MKLLTVRAHRVFISKGIDTAPESISNLTYTELRQIRGIGRITARRVEEWLKHYGLKLREGGRSDNEIRKIDSYGTKKLEQT